MAQENVVWHSHNVTKEQREGLTKQKACVLWFTGLSGSGKSTIASATEDLLHKKGNLTYLLDGDNVRHGLNRNLGFSDEDRCENIRRIGEVSKLFIDSGVITLTAFISPFISDREIVRDLLKKEDFIEVFIDTPLEVCEQRDPKGLYKKARSGEIKNFTGIDSPYEAPKSPEIHIKNDGISVEEACQKIIEYLTINNYITWSEDD